MTESAALMAVKVIGLVVAGIGFAVWQFRDLAKAQNQSKSKPCCSALDPEDAIAGNRVHTPDGHH
jgi:mannose/fructose/N-acetylgalactosamine-specific phosphotransferase system component IIC